MRAPAKRARPAPNDGSDREQRDQRPERVRMGEGLPPAGNGRRGQKSDQRELFLPESAYHFRPEGNAGHERPPKGDREDRARPARQRLGGPPHQRGQGAAVRQLPGLRGRRCASTEREALYLI